MALERNAPNFVTYTTAVQLRIKEIITQDLTRGVDRQTTFKRLKSIIEKFGATIADEYVRKQFELSLARGAVRIYEQTAGQLENIVNALAIPLVAVISALSGEKKNTSNNSAIAQTSKRGEQASATARVEREYLYEDRIEVPEVRKRLKAAIERLMFDIADEDIKDRNGASLRNVAEIHVRHDYQQASIEQMRANGVKLVWASTHVDCSPRCFPWQGKLYSLDGTYGTTDTGVSYVPLEVAVNVPYTTRAGKTYMNGLLGFNCRHRLIPYKNEQEPPKGYTKAQTVRAYQLDLKQRAMEREIRRVKERAHLLKGVQNGNDTGAINKLFAEARKMTEAYRKFCRDNDRVAMIYRTQVTVEEQTYNQRRQHTVYNDVINRDTGEVLVKAGTRLDKVRLIGGEGSKDEFRNAKYYVDELKGNSLQFRKMSGIIDTGEKRGKDLVHWVQDGSVNKAEEKDGRPKPKK